MLHDHGKMPRQHQGYTVKLIKSQILTGANPEKAARNDYEKT